MGGLSAAERDVLFPKRLLLRMVDSVRNEKRVGMPLQLECCLPAVTLWKWMRRKSSLKACLFGF